MTWARSYHVLRVALLWGVIAWLAHRVYTGRNALAALELEWQPLALLAALTAAIVAYQSLFFAWIVLLRRTDLYRAAYRDAYARIWWFSYLYRYVPGKFMLLVERARLGVSAGIPYAVGATLPVIETLAAVLAGGIVSLLAISYYAAESLPIFGAIALLAVIVVLLVPITFRALLKTRVLRERYPEMADISLSSADVLVLLVPYVAHYLLIGVSFFLLVRSAVPVSWLDLPGICGIYAMSHVISILVVIAPGGLGVREGALAVQLQKLTAVGVADVLAIAARLWFSAIELLCFAAVALRYRDDAGTDLSHVDD